MYDQHKGYQAPSCSTATQIKKGWLSLLHHSHLTAVYAYFSWIFAFVFIFLPKRLILVI